jgi:ELWxxDGT repeat protein
MMRPLGFLLALAVAGTASAASNDDSDPYVHDRVATVGSTAFFAGQTAAFGTELWATDGTAGATRLVADIAKGAASSSPYQITAVGSLVFFVADDGFHGRELWVSDGTAAGTHLVSDLVPGSGSSDPDHLCAAGSLLYFVVHDPTTGYALWRTDGTPGGTILLKDVLASASADEFDHNWHHVHVGVGSTLFLNANGGLWVSDGTAGGTIQLVAAGAAGGTPIAMAAFGSRCVYTSVDDGSKPWVSDGTVGGTSRITASVSSTDFNDSLGGLMYTRGTSSTVTNGVYTWDGASASMTLLSSTALAPFFFVHAGGSVFTSVDSTADASHRYLFRSDGTIAGSGMVGTCAVSDRLVGAGSRAFFASPNAGHKEFWSSDGTAAGTVRATTKFVDLLPVGSVGGSALAGTLSAQATLWASDGTDAGTVQLMPPLTPAGASPLPAGYLRNLLHLGSQQPDRILGGVSGPHIDTDDFLASGYGPEYLQQPAHGQAADLGASATEQPLVWTDTLATRVDGIWDDGYAGDFYRQYYAITLLVPSTRTARIAYWIDDRVRVWEDGDPTPILAVDANGSGSSAPFTLTAGVHRFLCKYEQITSSSVFAIKFTDSLGADLTDLGYTLADIVPPNVVSTSPADGATGVATGAVVSISFSEPMDTSVAPASVATVSGGASGSWAWSDRLHLAWTPSVALATGTSYTVSVAASALDRNGNALSPISVGFTTLGTTPGTTSAGSTTSGSTTTSGAPATPTNGTKNFFCGLGDGGAAVLMLVAAWWTRRRTG